MDAYKYLNLKTLWRKNWYHFILLVAENYPFLIEPLYAIQ